MVIDDRCRYEFIEALLLSTLNTRKYFSFCTQLRVFRQIHCVVPVNVHLNGKALITDRTVTFLFSRKEKN